MLRVQLAEKGRRLMNRWLLILSLPLAAHLCFSLACAAQAAEKTPAERGREIMFYRSLNPPIWSLKAYENVWKQWGLAAKPVPYAEAFMERYGLHAAPFDNKGRPLGLMEARGLFGKGIVNNCLLCHAGRVAGQTIIGLGNTALDLQSLFDELSITDGFKAHFPFQSSYVRGTVDPVNPLTYLAQFRDAELEVQKPVKLPFSRDVCSDPPAWWLLKRKKTRDWTGGVNARSARVDMVNLFTPLNSGGYIKKQETAFADISAYLLTIEAPKYPFAIDQPKAAQGKRIFKHTCARCHGSYGPEGTYPNKILPLDEIGTDPALANAMPPEVAARLNESWLAREIGPDGKPYRLLDHKGYQAPPLDGVWATAPYFHNSSAPTVYDVLNSKARPTIYSRSYRGEKEDYDPIKLGLKITVLEEPPVADLSGWERRKIYDTTQPGRGNGGHTFGDDLSEEERLAVIEYLKTL
jgi:mono/diheme cytochrome c family protein